jgi:glycosyltransferase involved in cell wall biosynthesis
MPIRAMKPVVRGAGVYLATARETFGIGTLEALASGVPVAGWDWGGQSEIILQGETGYLAPYGDLPALAECITRCIAERDRLGANARADAVARWGWEPRIEQYADLYKRVYAEWHAEGPRVSIIVTCHNLGQYLPECLQSVAVQDYPDLECVIVDDASTDNTPQIAAGWHAQDARFVYLPTPENLKLPGALNFGIAHARGRYVLPLDADNWLAAPDAVRILATALDADPGIHIAYGHLDVYQPGSGETRRSPGWPFEVFDWRGQMGHLNQITSTAMLRKDVHTRVGGYRTRMWRAEDAEFWCRATSLGFRAKKVTQASIFVYRNRPDSKSKGEQGDGNWCAWFPWSYATNAREGAARYGLHQGPVLDLVPWGAQSLPPQKDVVFWDVPDRQTPTVSVIIPVGPGHRALLIDALDSLVSQTFTDWEAIVVYDDGDPVPEYVPGAPWARQYATERPQSGPGVARNIGAKHARGTVLYFLDADDYLLPWSLDRMVKAWRATVNPAAQYPGDIVCSGWLRNDGDGRDMLMYAPHEWECGGVKLDMVRSEDRYRGVLRHMLHSVNVIIPRSVHEKIGGFDEHMTGWEDWDYFIAAQALAGECSTHLDDPLFVYRFRAGKRRESSFGESKELVKYIYTKWQAYYEGRRRIVCGCNKTQVNQAAQQVARARSARASVPVPTHDGEAVLLEYQLPIIGPMTVKGPVTGKLYRFGNSPSHKIKYVDVQDAAELLARSTRGVHHFTLAEQMQPTPPTPEPPTPAEVQAVTQAPLAAAPEPLHEEWPVMEPPPDVPPLPVAPEPEPEPEPLAPQAPSITGLSVRVARTLLPGASVQHLVAWLAEERTSAKPRQAIITAINRALSNVTEPDAAEADA